MNTVILDAFADYCYLPMPSRRMAIHALESAPAPGRGEDYLLTYGSAEGALAEWRKKARERPGDPTWHCSMGLLFFNQRDWEAAREELGKALALAGTRADAASGRVRLYLGVTALNMRQPEKAASHFEALPAGAGGDLKYRNLLLGLAYFRLGQLERCSAAWARAAAELPDNGPVQELSKLAHESLARTRP